jgi:predicted DNA-binding helix-hairpin-helix protein
MLDLDLDPKLAWALAHRDGFPVDVNRAPREVLLRVPGFGTRTVDRVLAARRHRTLRYEDLTAIGAVMARAQAFVQMPGWTPRGMLDDARLRARFAPEPEQLALW